MILEKKTIVISGVGTGLGAEIARVCMRDGANVTMGARTEAQLEAVAKEIDPSGKRVAWSRTDINEPEDCEHLAATAVERFGALDAVVQVAAFEYVFGGLQEANFDDWRKAFETNVVGTHQLLRAIVPRMQARKKGSVVLIGSQSMYLPLVPQAGYAASKGALLSSMYYLAKELGPDGIRVNTVVPSWMWGPPVEGYLRGVAQQKGISPEQALAEVTQGIPLRAIAADEDVAEAVVFFCSDRSRMITGQALLVNAGELMR